MYSQCCQHFVLFEQKLHFVIMVCSLLLLDADPYGITNKRKRKEVNVESFYSDRIPLSVWHEVKGSCTEADFTFYTSVLQTLYFVILLVLCAIFMARQMQENFRVKGQLLVFLSDLAVLLF